MLKIFYLLAFLMTWILPNVKPQVTQEDCVALILARGGSKQIPRKNLEILEGKSLLERSIEVAKLANVFSEIWVSTDDLKIHNEATRAGAKVFGRSVETSSDTASSLEAINEFHLFFPNITCICLLQCTSPFQSSLYLRRAYFKMIKFNYDSVFSAVRSHKLRWKRRKDGTVAAVNFDPKSRPRRQDLDIEYIENGMFYIFHVEVLKKGILQGGKIGVVEVPELRSIEIDTFDDLKEARLLASSLLPYVEQEKYMCSLDEF